MTRPITRIALLGTYLPRQCGIATFTADLTNAITAEFPQLDPIVLAMNDVGQRHTYPSQVRFEVPEDDRDAYFRAAAFLNVNLVDVLSVQHEYGIFGGKAGGHLLPLLRALRMPIVSTLHTVLGVPNDSQRRVMEELAALSTRLVVMSEHGAGLLQDRYDVPVSKIDLIPHGSPLVPLEAEAKERLGLQGRAVLLTFGLLSPDKGIEYVIDALPAILARFPSTVYVILGATHPHVKERHGEVYRLSLESRARERGVEANVIFHDRFVSAEALTDFLAAADICITPYLQPEQITSGALAYAVGAGKAIVSTPYRYATELLADGRGILVPPRDAGAVAGEVMRLLGDDGARRALGARASALGQGMHWPAVARQYLATFERARVEHAAAVGTLVAAQTLADRSARLPELNLVHLRRLTDDTGVLQHARYRVPRYEDGYCLDDNARALLLISSIEDTGTEERRVVDALANRYLAFASHAFNATSGRFRNFMSFSRAWTEECGSEDSQGRALWALGTVVGRADAPGSRSLAGDLFHAALPAVSSLASPRAWAYTLLGIDQYLAAFHGDRSVEAVGSLLAERLLGLHQRTSRPDWYWFEDRVTYCNARLSEALIVWGARMQRQLMLDVGLESLSWLLSIQGSSGGHFAPVGSNGFFERGGARARFDQQPVEACGVVSACLAAHRATGGPIWSERAQWAFDWFLGRNDLCVPLYDPVTGGCRDGLHADRANDNQGAESTISFLQALLGMRAAQLAVATNLTPAHVEQ
ncbi:MAG TPA: glycosyltransferase family 4 protein [Gemmatimonadales bacterium]|nr:glycosyltransferase family 4 protein [Gemmatimonadales bacterium]